MGLEKLRRESVRVSREYLYLSKLACNLGNNIFVFINKKSVHSCFDFYLFSPPIMDYPLGPDLIKYQNLILGINLIKTLNHI